MTTPAARGRVLIIDDDHMVGAMLVSHARAAGFDAKVTDSPEEFFATERAWKPDFVVVDLVMGEVDGLSILKELAEAHSTAAVVIASGMGSKILEAAQQFAAASGLAYGGVLSKPFRRADVAAVLEAGARSPEAPDSTADVLGSWSNERFELALREAAHNGELSVAYQPKVSCVDGSVTGYEALVRWEHPIHGNIPPVSFIPRAESVGLVSIVTDAVTSAALTWFGSHRLATREHLSINISATELTSTDLASRLLATCEECNVPAHRIVLELTETGAMSDATASLEVLTRLRLDGFQLSIDDFGTGYSSMAQLSNMPFSEVKIDRSFVRNLGTSLPADVMVRSMLQLSRGLGLECTAEGVETEEAMRVLSDLGCDYAQGYLIARPMPADVLEQWLAQREHAA